jgi:hypothetical protein
MEMLLDKVKQSVHRGTQKIPRQQKLRIWADTKMNKWSHRSPK